MQVFGHGQAEVRLVSEARVGHLEFLTDLRPADRHETLPASPFQRREVRCRVGVAQHLHAHEDDSGTLEEEGAEVGDGQERHDAAGASAKRVSDERNGGSFGDDESRRGGVHLQQRRKHGEHGAPVVSHHGAASHHLPGKDVGWDGRLHCPHASPGPVGERRGPQPRGVLAIEE